jgi:dynein heavy chain 1, cytosolic
VNFLVKCHSKVPVYFSIKVEEMQKSLNVKSQELQQKNEAANAKLKQMFKDQQEAEKKKVQSQAIQLAEQTIKIDEKRKNVMSELELVGAGASRD